MKDISELLGSKYPIIQGAMGVICNPEFVAAVSEAGGYGLLATAFEKDPDKLKARVDAVKALTEGDLSASILGAGQITGMIKAVRPVRDMIEEMVHGS